MICGVMLIATILLSNFYAEKNSQYESQKQEADKNAQLKSAFEFGKLSLTAQAYQNGMATIDFNGATFTIYSPQSAAYLCQKNIWQEATKGYFSINNPDNNSQTTTLYEQNYLVSLQK